MIDVAKAVWAWAPSTSAILGCGKNLRLNLADVDSGMFSSRLPSTYRDNDASDEQLAAACRLVGFELDIALFHGNDKIATAGLLTNAQRCELPKWNKLTEKHLDGMVQQLKDLKFYGPYGIFYSGMFAAAMDDTYKGSKDANFTLRKRLQQDYVFVEEAHTLLPRDEIVIVQLTPNVVRIVVGMEPQLKPLSDNKQKVLCIIVPQIRADIYGNVGVIEAVYNRDE